MDINSSLINIFEDFVEIVGFEVFMLIGKRPFSLDSKISTSVVSYKFSSLSDFLIHNVLLLLNS